MSIEGSLVYQGGRWIDAADMNVNLVKSGILYSETISEALRTFRRRPFDVTSHIKRLERSMEMAHIALPARDLSGLIEELIDLNLDLLNSHGIEDIVIKLEYVCPPFDIAWTEPLGSLLAFLLPLPTARIERWHAGMHCTISSIRNVPAACGIPFIKHRGRLHHAIAYRQAKEVNPDCEPILLDIDGFVSEGASWNIIAVRGDRLIFPKTDALEGTSLAVVRRLAIEQNIPCEDRRMSRAELEQCDEVLATGTSFCVAPIIRIDSSTVGMGVAGPVFSKLARAWSDLVGVDILVGTKWQARD